MGSQKFGDMYNYYSGAYLLTQIIEELPSFNHKNASVDVDPNEIMESQSSFNQKISFDIILTSKELVLFSETKHSKKPKNASYNSIDFKDAFLEFLDSEKYRKKQHNSESILYLFVTNLNTILLKQKINHLKLANDDDINEYIKKLVKRAPHKWPKLKGKKITISLELFKTVLSRIIVLELTDRDIERIENEDDFKQAFDILIKQISPKNDLYQKYVILDKINHINMIVDNDITYNYIIDIDFKTSISQNLFKIINNNMNDKLDLLEIDLNKHDIELNYDLKINRFLIIKKINETINNIIKLIDYTVVLDYSLSNLYIVKTSKIVNIINSSKNKKGLYDIELVKKLILLYQIIQ